MHYLLRFIVEAEDAKEANNHTVCIVDELVEQYEIDWYSEEADDSRWDECWQPVRLETKKAQAMVQAALDEQFDEFVYAMDAIRAIVANHTDEQIFNQEFKQIPGKHLSRYQFTKAGGKGCQLFDTNGSTIMNRKELDYYLKEPKGLWVVQVDCHN